jgi:hypothetical protein
MPAACSHDKIAPVASTPRSIGPVARLNKNSVGIPNLDAFATAVSGSFLLGDDIGEAQYTNRELKKMIDAPTP